jgi:tRNA modification GTPase
LHVPEDTIAAISTPSGEGGIGIVRLSGAQAVDIAQTFFQGSRIETLHTAPPYSLHHGRIIDPDTDTMLDEVLVSVMRAPHSYTREDVVEINCHGGSIALRKILDLVLAHGARLASPGEFTKRAFLNGRIDLAQAESVVDIIRAKTDAGLQLAVQQLHGKLSAHLQQIHTQLKHLLASIEASIDFVEDDIELISQQQILFTLEQISIEIARLLANANEGKIVRDGLCVAIVGKPNVGKSSLLNLFLEEERAIVTPIPGTTRDTIEDYVNLHGIPLRLIDTAGIRHTDDHVESLGVAKSRQALEQADIVLCMFDAACPWSQEDEDILQAIGQQPTFFLLNKIDLPAQINFEKIQAKSLQPNRTFQISIKEHQGIDEAKQALVDHVMTVPLESVEVTNSRHKQALTLSQQALLRAKQSTESDMSQEFIALDLRDALDQIGRITGETTTEEILDDIFSTFCIGK